MLTIFEKILFIIAVAAALYFGYQQFMKVFQVIRRGKGELIPQSEMVDRGVNALQTWLTLRPIWKTRTVASVFHAMIAWGFVFYLLVNFGDVVEGFFPITFLGQGFIGDVYRFLADILTVSVLIGMTWFLMRRFMINDKALTVRDNVMIVDKVREGGIRRDSLIVGIFMLCHVGFRLLGESFKIAVHRGETGHGDWSSPFANLVSNLWAGWPHGLQILGWHVGWWVALGLILAFIPYFPYTKHFHLIMSMVNFFSKPHRTSLGALESIDFGYESIE